MAEIVIHSIERSQPNIVECCLQIGEKNEIIRTVVSENVADFLTVDRCDAFVVGLLYSAMQKGFDLKSSIPISEDLLYNIENYFLDALALPGTGLSRIKFDMPTISPCEKVTSAVATGISCGVDSLYTIAIHENPKFPSQKITHLAFHNVGGNDRGVSDEDTQRLFEGRLNLCRNFALENGYEFYTVSSNLNKIIAEIVGDYSHVSNHTYVNAFCTMLLQKGISKYYYSAGYGYELFRSRRLNEKEDFDASHYDILSLNAFSMSGLRFYSVGAGVLRKDKTEFLAHYKPATKYLNVCVNTVKNDCTCFKCTRTLLTLDGLGKLEDFKEAFDISYYLKHRKDYLEALYIESNWKHDPLMEEIYPMFRNEITVYLKISAIYNKVVKMIKARI